MNSFRYWLRFRLWAGVWRFWWFGNDRRLALTGWTCCCTFRWIIRHKSFVTFLMRGRVSFWVCRRWSSRKVLSWTVLRVRSRQLRLGVPARFVSSFFPSSFLLLIARISLCSPTVFVASSPMLRLCPCFWPRSAGRCDGSEGQYAKFCISSVFSCKLRGFCIVS